MSPDVAAVSTDAVHLVNLHLVRFAVGRMSVRTNQPRPLHMDRVRKPHISRLPRVHQPWSLMSRFDKVIDQRRLSLAFSNPLGVASRAFLHRRNSTKGTALAKRVPLTPLPAPSLFP